MNVLGAVASSHNGMRRQQSKASTPRKFKPSKKSKNLWTKIDAKSTKHTIPRY
jgi:hypothetical protein